MFAKSVAGALPDSYGRAPGPTYLRGAKTCTAVMTRLFKYFHAQLAGSIQVIGVRIKGNQAVALLHSRTFPNAEMWLDRRQRKWIVEQMLGGTLP